MVGSIVLLLFGAKAILLRSILIYLLSYIPIIGSLIAVTYCLRGLRGRIRLLSDGSLVYSSC